MVDTSKLRGLLAERRLPQWRLAKRLGYAPSTLSDYLRGARPAPPDLVKQIEQELRLPPGALTQRA
jgi:transcriptional regulator with XRE-family HTH domain